MKKQAEWIGDSNIVLCGACNKFATRTYLAEQYSFCPNCGEKIKGRKEVKLSLCPFCSGLPILEESSVLGGDFSGENLHRVVCSVCRAGRPNFFLSKEAAIGDWNERNGMVLSFAGQCKKEEWDSVEGEK